MKNKVRLNSSRIYDALSNEIDKVLTVLDNYPEALKYVADHMFATEREVKNSIMDVVEILDYLSDFVDRY